jgi:hypothetical protein
MVDLLEEEDALPLANQFDKASDEDGVLLDVSLELDPVNTIPKLINKEWPLLLVNNLSLLQGLVVTCRESLTRDCNQQFAKDFWEELVNVLGVKPHDMVAAASTGTGGASMFGAGPKHGFANPTTSLMGLVGRGRWWYGTRNGGDSPQPMAFNPTSGVHSRLGALAIVWASVTVKLLQQQVAAGPSSSSCNLIGGAWLASVQVTSWMTLNAPTTGSHIAFLDTLGSRFSWNSRSSLGKIWEHTRCPQACCGHFLKSRIIQ